MCLHIHNSLMTKKKPLYGNIRIIYSEMKQIIVFSSPTKLDKSNGVGSIFALSECCFV